MSLFGCHPPPQQKAKTYIFGERFSMHANLKLLSSFCSRLSGVFDPMQLEGNKFWDPNNFARETPVKNHLSDHSSLHLDRRLSRKPRKPPHRTTPSSNWGLQNDVETNDFGSKRRGRQKETQYNRKGVGKRGRRQKLLKNSRETAGRVHRISESPPQPLAWWHQNTHHDRPIRAFPTPNPKTYKKPQGGRRKAPRFL